jgi:hypothetical protein
MSDSDEVALAEVRAQVAKQRLFATIGDVQDRLSPRTLAQDAIDGLKEGTAFVGMIGVEAARRRPGIAVTATGLIALLLARKPLAKLFRSDNNDATAAPLTSLKTKRAARPKKGPTP